MHSNRKPSQRRDARFIPRYRTLSGAIIAWPFSSALHPGDEVRIPGNESTGFRPWSDVITGTTRDRRDIARCALGRV